MSNAILEQLGNLSAAEDFFHYFDLPYEQSVVNVNRLHIMKRFNQYLRKAPDISGLDEAAARTAYRELLQQAYQDFITSTPLQEKVFKVFQDQDGKQHVSLDSLRQSLPSHSKEG